MSYKQILTKNPIHVNRKTPHYAYFTRVSESYINIPLQSDTRANGHKPRNIERSSEEDNTWTNTPSPNYHINGRIWAMSSLVVRASDSRSEGLVRRLMPPNTFRVHAEYVLIKSVVPNALWMVAVETTSSGD
ncbi:hypothetical protein TNCV_1414461 [Trichonephila clavipes]|nr:hypothetical protein TNCV_1414461 [Trichonephila clavipes]